jgi:peptidyl-prolyl cis-trans isomerase D
MLSLFRRGGVGQVLVVAIVAAIIIVFVLEFRAGRGPMATSDQQCPIKVYGRCVDAKEYNAAFALVAPRGIEPKDIKRLGLRRLVLDGLVERELLLKEARDLKLNVSGDAVEQQLMAGRMHVSLPVAYADHLSYQLGLCPPQEYAPACQPGAQNMVRQLQVESFETKRFDYKIYERVVRNTTNRSPREFKEMQEAEIVAARMRDLVRSRVIVSEEEAYALFERDRSRATTNTTTLRRDWFARYAVDSSPAAADAWALENKEQVDSAWKSAEEGWTAGCPLVSEIAVDFPSGAEDNEKVLARERIDAAEKRIRGGEDFAAVAREASEADSAILGGYVGCLSEKSYGSGADELLEAVKNLAPGAVSAVVETTRGFRLLKLHELLPAESVQDRGRTFVAQRLAVRFRADEMARKFATELIDRVKAGESLEAATDELAKRYAAGTETDKKPRDKAKQDKEPAALAAADRPRAQTSSPFSIASSPIDNPLPGSPLGPVAFALEPGAVHPAPVETADGVAVLQLASKELATREQFDKERDQILGQLMRAKAADALVRHVAELRKAAGKSIVVDSRFAEDPKGSEPGGE